MKQRPALCWLVALIAVLAMFATGMGLFFQNNGTPFMFTTVRGEAVEIWGQGWYSYDTPIGALGFRAADLVTLVLAIPLLVISAVFYRRGSLRGGLLLTGVLSYFLYNYISMGFGAAYNNLFLAYVIIFSASLYGLALTLASFDLQAFPLGFGASLPRKGISLFLIVSGIILSLVWLGLSIIPALIQNTVPPEAYYYTTFVTGTVDIGMVSPALILAGVLLLRRIPFGYLLASTMLIFTALLGPNLTAGGIIQVMNGVITTGQAMVFTVPFVILSLIALWFTVRLFTTIQELPNENQ
jgi:hypothetical protein